MRPPSEPLFVARRGYRRRRLEDAARLMPLLGAIILRLPFSHTGVVTFSDALFTAASAVTVTGLVVVDTGSDYTLMGQIVIALLIQIGGLGLMTFAALFVVGIIVGVASYAFALPAQLYSLASLGIWSGEVDAENFNVVDPVAILLGTISTLAQFLLNIITVVAGVFIYFDLNEKKNFTGTYERIENLGESTD